LALVTGAFVWAWSDPVPAIRDELRAAASDPTNHEPYADLVRAELGAADRLQTVTFSMPCFWAGESHFGGLEGVYRTTPGTQAGKEVVRVAFDPRVTSYDDLLAAPPDPAAKGRGCRYDPDKTAPERKDPAFVPDDLEKWSLRQTDGLKCVPMTPAQAARVNALFHAGRPVEPWLSPTQNKLLAKVRKNPNADWTEYVGNERLWDLLRTQATGRK
jgi:hypothetical protein